MTRSRDLLSGVSLVLVAGWFLLTTGAGGGRVTLLVASVGCGLAGVAYLIAGAEIAPTVAGRDLSAEHFRSIAVVVLGVSILALGADGIAAGLDALSLVLLVGGLLAVAAGWLRLARVGRVEAGRDEPRSDGES
ncbi:hypothetical protein SAMN04488066_1097 [Halorubrum aquaticum]|uniref:Uncharacterized protein n=1 Tax=Halorubrum aquaticum TaxID=387340 RepID=A0A1I3B2X0_9EURY|nr:hypothetical protein [Halorubrum aquaticum]SFH56436.1 hypothetical protein SAMN04488066_1097 [Halorubrum aquaticum]